MIRKWAASTYTAISITAGNAWRKLDWTILSRRADMKIKMIILVKINPLIPTAPCHRKATTENNNWEVIHWWSG